MRLFVLLAALLTIAGCATTAPAASEPLYYVMRHLHTPAGERDPDLTAEGQRQAALLGGVLRDRPRIIYVSSFKRTRQTAAPLAAALGLTPIVYDPADTPALLARVRQGPFPVLIVGHSNTVPDIVGGLGGERPAPLVHEDFGDIWQIAADGATTRLRLDGAGGR
jgi:phosphohistidine phosphatase SixA